MAAQDKRKAPYQAKSEVDSFAGLTEKLARDLRTHIRGLSAFSVLSDPWCRMANGLERIGNVTEMERQLPKEDKDATIWECEEQALRFVMEDGKLNLCLRLMVDFKAYERERLQPGGGGAGDGDGDGDGDGAGESKDGESKEGESKEGGAGRPRSPEGVPRPHSSVEVSTRLGDLNRVCSRPRARSLGLTALPENLSSCRGSVAQFHLKIL